MCLYSNQNVRGAETSKSRNRPKISTCDLHSTNELPVYSATEQSELSTVEAVGQPVR